MNTRTYLYAAFLLLLSLCFTACHKDASKASRHLRTIKHSHEAIHIDEDQVFDFSTLDTASYYYGEVNDSTYFFKIDRVSPDGCIGRFYLVTQMPQSTAQRFEIQYKDNEYLFCTSTKDIPIKFSITLDTNAITGTFSNASRLDFDENTLAFEKYYEPVFQYYSSTRYNATSDDELLSYQVKKDIEYGSARGFWASNPIDNERYSKIIAKSMAKTFAEREVPLTMDLYIPDDTIKKHPLLVLIHGGAFFVGDKGAETMTTWCQHFAQQGYVVATINYRMGFRLSKQSIQQCGYEAIQDAHAALRHLVANSKEYGIDPDYIFVGGTSAGAITALAVAFMTNDTRPQFVFDNHLDSKLGNLESASNKLSNTFKIRAVANMWGAVYDLGILSNHTIPVISFHGTDDNIVPFDQGHPFEDIKSNIGEKLFDMMYGSKSIHLRLDSLHVRNEFYPIEGVKHAPYQDKGGHPNSTYFFIQDKMQHFFYNELTKVTNLTKVPDAAQQYQFAQGDVTCINWKVEGGFILNQQQNTVTVLWRKDARNHTLIASGMRSNGCAFTTKKKF